MDPSVAISGGRFSLQMRNALKMPTRKPISRQASSARNQGTPLISIRPQKTVPTPTTEPTDKSMPPVMRTMVMPTAMIPLMAT